MHLVTMKGPRVCPEMPWSVIHFCKHSFDQLTFHKVKIHLTEDLCVFCRLALLVLVGQRKS